MQSSVRSLEDLHFVGVSGGLVAVTAAQRLALVVLVVEVMVSFGVRIVSWLYFEDRTWI